MRKLVLVCVLVLASAAVAQPFHEGKYSLFPSSRSVDRESSHHYDVRFYRIDLALPMNSGAMTARVSIDLTPSHDDFDTFSLHMVNLVCDSIRRAGNVCTFTTPSGRLLVDLDRTFANGESLSVDIFYHRNSGTQNRGFYWYAKGAQGIPYAVAYSVTETDDSRYWFPCFDQPWDKAERGCQINVTVPDTMSACANGVLDSVSAGSGAKVFWWTHKYPISTYLMCFAASKFTDWRAWWQHGSDSMPVRYYVWPQDSVQAANNFSLMGDMLSYFSQDDIYGLYPFADEKYGMVAVYPYPWGGMEHQTMTTIHRYWAVYGSVNGIAHELAHQWWGDMVTCLDWRDIWLNEGFATYSDELYEYRYRGRSSFLSMIQQRAQSYFDEEASYFRPIYDPPAGLEFDWGHTYCKAAWVQHMLRYVVGDTVWSQPGLFFRLVRAYGDSFRMGSANTEDYRRIAEQVSGLDLFWFYDEWVYHGGYPVYSLGWQGRQTGDAWEVVLELAQNNHSGAPPVFHMPVEVRVNWSGGNATFRYDVSTDPQQNVFPIGGEPTSVVFDPNDWILDQHETHVGVTEGQPVPYRTALRLAGPNPTAGAVRLAYELAAPAQARIDIYDGSGRLTRTLLEGQRPAGRYSATWDRKGNGGHSVAAGTYFCRLSAGSESRTIRLVLAD
jgi:aminopeptidase N